MTDYAERADLDTQVSGGEGRCPVHGEPWVAGTFLGRRRCSFYVPELGASEDYGCDLDTQILGEGDPEFGEQTPGWCCPRDHQHTRRDGRPTDALGCHAWHRAQVEGR